MSPILTALTIFAFISIVLASQLAVHYLIISSLFWVNLWNFLFEYCCLEYGKCGAIMVILDYMKLTLANLIKVNCSTAVSQITIMHFYCAVFIFLCSYVPKLLSLVVPFIVCFSPH